MFEATLIFLLGLGFVALVMILDSVLKDRDKCRNQRDEFWSDVKKLRRENDTLREILEKHKALLERQKDDLCDFLDDVSDLESEDRL